MKNWQDLPPEISDLIFRNLKQNDIAQCSLTCTAWRFIAQRVLFKNLKLSTFSDMRELENAFLTVSSNHHHSLGRLVRNLKFVAFEGGFDIALLDRLFPFLEVMSLCGQIKFYESNLYQLLKEGRFPNLKKTPFTKLNDAHLELMLARKEGLKELELRRLYLKKSVLKLYENLPLLPRLELLQLQLSPSNSVLYMETFLSQEIPTVKTIILEFSPEMYAFTTKLVDGHILPLHNVKEVRIFFQQFFFDDSGCSYFIKKFPSLHVLDIKTNTDKIFTFRSPLARSREWVYWFLKYLFTIKDRAFVSAIVTNHFTADVVKDFFNYALRKAIFKNSETHLKIDFEIFVPQQALDFPNDRTACIAPRIKYSNGKLCEMKVIYRNSLKNMYHFYLELVQKVGGMNIESLTIGGDNWKDSSSQEVPIHLDTVLHHLKNLKKLAIHESQKIYFSNLQSPQSMLEYLELHSCALKEKIFPNISQSCPNLTVLKISVCRFKRSVVRIKMPGTHLRELHFSIRLDVQFKDYSSKEAIIKLKTTNDKSKYYKIILKRPFNSEKDSDFHSRQYKKADYKKWLKNETCVVYKFHFEAVTKLFIKVEK